MSARLNPYEPLTVQEETEDGDNDSVNGGLQSLKARGNVKIEFVKKSMIGLDRAKQAEFLEELNFWDWNSYRWWDPEENSSLNLMPYRDQTRHLEQTNGVAAERATELRQHLVGKRGWCPSTVTVILDALHVPGLLLSSLIFTDDPSGTCKRKSHGGLAVHSAPFHQRCTPMECLETRYSEGPPCHVEPNCPCSKFEDDAPRLDEIIRGGQIPIISVSKSTGAMKLQVITPTTQYLTISYVWSQFHPMTPCQITRLLDVIEPEFSTRSNKLFRKFWLDILCVPQDKNRYADSKRKAIDSIPEVYGGSHVVLVLDDLLLQAKPHESATIIGIRILACEWMRRVWTLQEAARATSKKPRRLVFCVGRGYKVFEDILQGLANEPWQLSGMVLEALKARLVFSAGPGKSMQSPAVFDRLLTTLMYRGCSLAEDEAPCIAAILRSTLRTETSRQLENIGWCMREEVEQEMQQHDDIERFVAGRRMKELFVQLRHFPLSLLFCQGLRISEAPFRCLPYSFIARSTQLRTRVESRWPNRMATCNDKEVAFMADADVFTLATSDDPEFKKVHLFTCVGPPGHRTRKPLYKQKRIEQTHWDKKLTEEGILPEDQGWASLRDVKRTDHLALITSDADRKAGIILKIRNISHLNREDVKTDFLCRVFVGEETERDRTASSKRGESFLAETQFVEVNPDSATDDIPSGFKGQDSDSEEGETPDETTLNAGSAPFRRSSGEWQANNPKEFSCITARSAYRIRACCWRICG